MAFEKIEPYVINVDTSWSEGVEATRTPIPHTTEYKINGSASKTRIFSTDKCLILVDENDKVVHESKYTLEDYKNR